MDKDWVFAIQKQWTVIQFHNIVKPLSETTIDDPLPTTGKRGCIFVTNYTNGFLDCLHYILP